MGDRQFGTNDKVGAAHLGALIVVFGLGVTVGVLAMGGARSAAFSLTGVIGVVGAWAVLIRPAPRFGKPRRRSSGRRCRWWCSGTSLLAATGATADGPQQCAGRGDGGRSPPVRGGRGRLGIRCLVVGGVGRLLQQRFEVSAERSDIALPAPASPSVVLPANVELPVEGMQPFVTPNTDFYRIDTALVVPQVSKDSWRLKIHGIVDNPIELPFADLLDRPQVERYVTLSCVSNPIGGDLVGNAVAAGVLLKDVLEEAGVQPGATRW